jgi:hypothetical protein
MQVLSHRVHSLEKIEVGDVVTVALFLDYYAVNSVVNHLASAPGRPAKPRPDPPARDRFELIAARVHAHGLDDCGALAVFDDVCARIPKKVSFSLRCGLRFGGALHPRGWYYHHVGHGGERIHSLICAKRIGPAPLRLVIRPSPTHAPVLADLLERIGEPVAAAIVRVTTG